SNLLWVTVLFVQACSAQPDTDKKMDDGKPTGHAMTVGDCKWTNEVCCDEQLYTHLQFEDLKRYMINYRDEVWKLTSPYFETHEGVPASRALCMPGLTAEDRFDARYLDVSIEQLENYICRIKNMGVCENSLEPDMIRIYYLRYDPLPQHRQSGAPEGYHDSHTLGFTPLLTSDIWSEDCLRSTGGQNPAIPIWIPEPGATPPSANHNQICPPLICPWEDSMIKQIDCLVGGM
ncbi:MAG: hypothetical protein KDB88_09035, partial [Flavobacteriales bacterium]|nr:hypothetical protein [Flavobacteriales bacterium]